MRMGPSSKLRAAFATIFAIVAANAAPVFAVACAGGSVAPPNDACADATPISSTITPFSTLGATTDGPPHDACDFFFDPQVHQDIWFTYVADFCGSLLIETCPGADYDTKIALYLGGPCPIDSTDL